MIEAPRLARALQKELVFSGLRLSSDTGVVHAARSEDEVAVTHVSELLEETELGLRLLKTVQAGKAMLVLVGDASAKDIRRLTDQGVFDVQPGEPEAARLANAVRNAMDLQSLRRRASRAAEQLKRHRYELRELIDTARTISSERDIHTLLDIILEQCRYITNADAGSIYIVEGKGQITERKLRFKLSQNDSLGANLKEFLLPVSRSSVAGAAVIRKRMLNIPDVHNLPEEGELRYDTSFDEKTGYRTCSMLAAPMISQSEEVIGVVQLINRKRDRQALLLADPDFDQQVIPFDSRCEEIVRTLAAHAAVSLENAILYADIRRIFDGFVKASVHAIEQRDPTTSGHTERVAALTWELAQRVMADTGVFDNITFTERELLELRYASLLHDFGKIGVREAVLTKPKKLPGRELEMIVQRFETAKLSRMCESASRETLTGDEEVEEAAGASEAGEPIERLDELVQLVIQSNEPNLLDESTSDQLVELSKLTYRDADGRPRRLLTDSELKCLSIRRGSLTPEELQEVRSHAEKTFEFLSRIPWGAAFEDLPLIASSHHEKLDGSGYPHKLENGEIPLQARIMAVADIFDALVAADRPYKKAVPIPRALQILKFEAKDNHLDPDLVDLFIATKVYDCVATGGGDDA